MCGIFGYVGPRRADDVIVRGLKHLEYRGYDSAGLAVSDGQSLGVLRSVGKLHNLEALLIAKPLAGHCGIGHTRWATHGRPNETNAHPHADCRRRLMVVHNGIIENHVELKHELAASGHRFDTDTDTEVVAHLVESLVAEGLAAAVARAARRLEGSYALAVIDLASPDTIVALRNGPPLVFGTGDNEAFLSSDLGALLTYTREVYFPEDGQVVQVTPAGLSLVALGSAGVEFAPCTTTRITWDSVTAEKAGFKHYMLKEIHEQPGALRDTIVDRYGLEEGEVFLGEAEPEPGYLAGIKRVTIIACGTAFHAAMLGKYYLEGLARVPVEVDTGSEFRYRDPLVGEDTLVIAVSQSGETADTLAALKEAKRRKARILAVVNAQGSLMTREADHVLYLKSGPEIGVASTKAFTSMLAALFLVAVRMGRARGTLAAARARELLAALVRIPHQMESLLAAQDEHGELVRRLTRANHVLYLGRGVNFPIALEGALKLKEISYIHAEGYAAGEMKHGPIALIDEEMPVVAIATPGVVYDKMLSNIEEVRARGGWIIAIAAAEDKRIATLASHVITVPQSDELLSPLLNVVPLQLLAYQVAEKRGCDVDQPRNLAKSVTVE